MEILIALLVMGAGAWLLMRGKGAGNGELPPPPLPPLPPPELPPPRPFNMTDSALRFESDILDANSVAQLDTAMTQIVVDWKILWVSLPLIEQEYLSKLYQYRRRALGG